MMQKQWGNKEKLKNNTNERLINQLIIITTWQKFHKNLKKS